MQYKNATVIMTVKEASSLIEKGKIAIECIGCKIEEKKTE